MWWMLFAPLAGAGDLVIEAKVPVEIFADGVLIGQLAQPAELKLIRDAGTVDLTLMVSGRPEKFEVEVPEAGTAWVIVGRTGITTDQVEAPAVEVEVIGAVEFRVSGHQTVTLILDEKRHVLGPGESLSMEIDAGRHPLAVRSEGGTVVWAQGILVVEGGSFVVQLSDGRLPEVAGEGARFQPDGS